MFLAVRLFRPAPGTQTQQNWHRPPQQSKSTANPIAKCSTRPRGAWTVHRSQWLGTRPQNSTVVWKKIFPFCNSYRLEPLCEFCPPMLKSWRDADKLFSSPFSRQSIGFNIEGQNPLNASNAICKKGTNFIHRVVYIYICIYVIDYNI